MMPRPLGGPLRRQLLVVLFRTFTVGLANLLTAMSYIYLHFTVPPIEA